MKFLLFWFHSQLGSHGSLFESVVQIEKQVKRNLDHTSLITPISRSYSRTLGHMMLGQKERSKVLVAKVDIRSF